MKFLCVPCDSPMKLQTVGPPERGSLSVVYSCPECGYEMAMLTNAYETQVVQSLGVRIGPETGASSGASATAKCPFPGMIPATDDAPGAQPGQPGVSMPVRWTAAAEARLANIPSSCVPWHGPASRDLRRREAVSKWTRRSSTRPKTSSECDSGWTYRHRTRVPLS